MHNSQCIIRFFLRSQNGELRVESLECRVEMIFNLVILTSGSEEESVFLLWYLRILRLRLRMTRTDYCVFRRGDLWSPV